MDLLYASILLVFTPLLVVPIDLELGLAVGIALLDLTEEDLSMAAEFEVLEFLVEAILDLSEL